MKELRSVLVLSAAMIVAGGRWSSVRADATCVQNAKATYRSCVSQCKADFVDARLTCRNVQPACGVACLAGRQACMDNVDNILQTGQLPDGSTLANCTSGTDQCRANFRAAKQACGVPCQPSDTQCIECVDNAQVTDFECRDTCRDSWRTNPTVIAMQQSCRDSFRACIQQCPPATP